MQYLCVVNLLVGGGVGGGGGGLVGAIAGGVIGTLTVIMFVGVSIMFTGILW